MQKTTILAVTGSVGMLCGAGLAGCDDDAGAPGQDAAAALDGGGGGDARDAAAAADVGGGDTTPDVGIGISSSVGVWVVYPDPYGNGMPNPATGITGRA